VRLPLIDRLPIVGPLVNDVVEGAKVFDVVTPTTPQPVEPKVAASTVATSATGLVMGLLTPLLNRLPAPIRWVTMAILPAIITAAAGYFAPPAKQN
jgi:hypothetical protein